MRTSQNPFYVQQRESTLTVRWVVFWGGKVVSPEFKTKQEAVDRAEALYDLLKWYAA